MEAKGETKLVSRLYQELLMGAMRGGQLAIRFLKILTMG
jgi:hypothetical protein